MMDLRDVFGADVSRETENRLARYLDLLKKWNPKINLVSSESLQDAWNRHILDSAQLIRFAPATTETWADLGSGGGFPGLVTAILRIETDHPTQTILVESDQRKAAFMRTVIRATEVSAKVETQRIEILTPQNAQVISARALAPLSKLLTYVHRHLAPGGTALLLKGQNWQEELRAAQESWTFGFSAHKSVTNDDAVILEIGGLAHV